MQAINVGVDGVEPIGRRRRAYGAIATAMIMAGLDGSIANTALPTIARELHVGASSIVWVINGFNLAVTAALVAAAAYGSSLGLVRVYRAGIVAFTVGSIGCALSHSFAVLVAARVMQGVGAAMIMAIQPALVRFIFPRAELARAFGWNAVVASAASAAGPTVGGFLLSIASWPWLFAINVPIALLAVLLGRGALPAIAGDRARLDVASLLTSAVGFSLLIYGIDGFSRGETPTLIALEIGLGAITFGWFVKRQFRLSRPVIALDLFKIPAFASAARTSFVAWTAWGMGFVTLPFVLQLDRGVSPLVSGLLLTSWPIGNMISAPFAARAAERMPVRIVATFGLALFAFGLALYAVFSHVAPTLAFVGMGFAAGVGFGWFQSPNNAELLGASPVHKGSSAGALLATLRVSGQTVGGSLVAIALAWAERTHPVGFAGAAAPVALWGAAAVAAGAAIASLRRTA